jgi:hypothetical protein
MLIILVIVVWGVSPSQITVCSAPCAFVRGEPSQAHSCISPLHYTAGVKSNVRLAFPGIAVSCAQAAIA